MPYAPVYELGGPRPTVVTAQSNGPLLEGWFRQSVLPISITPMARWMFDERSFTPPAPSGPSPASSTGRLWPRP